MPIGKSGKYYMNPHEMRRHEGDSGGDKMSDKPGMDKPDVHGKTENDSEHQGGDGAHHHEIIKHDDGMVRSIHTHPDGQKEEQEHGSYDEAKADMDAKMGEGGESEEQPVVADDGSDGEDMAGMYAGCGD